MDAGFTVFDLFAIIVLFISGLMALMRGFVREALTVTAFVAAALAALWARPVIAGILDGIVGGALIANLAAMAVVFVLVYLAVSFVTQSLQRNVKSGDEVTTIDRALGVGFGVARGLVLIGLLVLVFNSALAGSQPSWLTGARVYPLANATAQLLQQLAPNGSWAERSAADDAPGDIDQDPIGRLIERQTSEDPRG